MSVELRPPRPDEAAEIAALVNRVSGELFGERDETEATIRRWLTAPELDPEQDMRLAVSAGELVGYADLGAHPEPKFWLDLRVPPSVDDEVRHALIGWGEQRAAERRGTVIRGFAPERDERDKAAFERAGYELIRHSFRMRIDFDEPPPEPEWPDGVTVRLAADEDVRTAYDTYTETFEDTWEFGREPYEEWSHWMLEEDLDLSLWFVAEEAGDVAGVALCKPWEAEEGLGWVRVLGVRRPWRRRGVGRALLLHVFGEFHRRGFHGVGLGVDGESLTGAVRLYENAGMRVFRRSDIYEKLLGG
ncbi:MAG TPA: GNAT family N-acetyltransferase [Gaiellaceae bacterium]